GEKFLTPGADSASTRRSGPGARPRTAGLRQSHVRPKPGPDLWRASAPWGSCSQREAAAGRSEGAVPSQRSTRRYHPGAPTSQQLCCCCSSSRLTARISCGPRRGRASDRDDGRQCREASKPTAEAVTLHAVVSLHLWALRITLSAPRSPGKPRRTQREI